MLELLCRFSHISAIQVFKPKKHKKKHTIKSSFYLIATNEHPDCESAPLAVEE
jgi:hypothetical protein